MDPRHPNQQKADTFNMSSNESISMQATTGGQGPSMDSILDHSASLINHLLPDQSALPWSTFATMPIYSPSFGLDGGGSSSIDCSLTTNGDDGHQIGSFHATHQNAPSLFLPANNLLNRFNPLGSDGSSAIFSSPSCSSGSIGGQRESDSNYRRADSAMGVRSYSSVLHSQPEPSSVATRYSMFGSRESVPLDNQAHIIPRSAIQLSQHQQQQYPQQHRHMGQFSTTNDQSNYPMQHNHVRQTPFAASGQSGIINGNNPGLGNQQNHGSSPFGSRIGVGLSDKIIMGSSGGILATDTATSTNNSYSGAVNKRRSKLPFFSNSNSGDGQQHSLKVDLYGAPLVNSDGSERFSRKVFVGGLPPDIDEEEIKASFRRFGLLIVDWPHKAESKSYFPPKGYAFLLFHEESSVQALIDACLQEEDKLYLCVSSPTIKDKPVQIRPWRLSDADYVLDSTLALDPRKTVFVGGVPRPLKASELANIMNNLYGGVCYAGIDTDPELKYPKGAGRVAFSNHQSYIAAISARFVHLQHCEIEKRVEVKPYVLDDQFCDECQGARCANKFAPFFCANITCLRYYCENCWSTVHSQPGRAFHKPLVKEGADRPRGVPVRWCS